MTSLPAGLRRLPFTSDQLAQRRSKRAACRQPQAAMGAHEHHKERPQPPSVEPLDDFVFPTVATSQISHKIDTTHFPDKAMPAQIASMLCKDLRLLDNSPRLNLASYVSTWMEEPADDIFNFAKNVNLADSVQYPSSALMEQRCVTMLADLWRAPDPSNVAGCATVGSSEGVMMGGLAMKRRWERQRKEAGLPFDKPNVIFGENAHVSTEKFARYFDVEARLVPVEDEQWVMHPDRALDMVDENTIGIMCMFSSTYNGEYEDVKAVHDGVVRLKEEKGWDVPIHVDAAAGGFVAPFIHPDLPWDFRLPQVLSINASGHKYGMVYPGVGWVLWRTKEDLPEELVFKVAYLGQEQTTFNLNFSMNAAPIACQYYNFIRLGRDGYRRILENHMDVKWYLTQALEETGKFKILSNADMPVVAFALKPDDNRSYDEYDIMERLREYRWLLPAYNMPANAGNQKLLRAVVRSDLNIELAEDLVNRIKQVLEWLDSHYHFTSDQMDELKRKFQGYRKEYHSGKPGRMNV